MDKEMQTFLFRLKNRIIWFTSARETNQILSDMRDFSLGDKASEIVTSPSSYSRNLRLYGKRTDILVIVLSKFALVFFALLIYYLAGRLPYSLCTAIHCGVQIGLYIFVFRDASLIGKMKITKQESVWSCFLTFISICINVYGLKIASADKFSIEQAVLFVVSSLLVIFAIVFRYLFLSEVWLGGLVILNTSAISSVYDFYRIMKASSVYVFIPKWYIAFVLGLAFSIIWISLFYFGYKGNTGNGHAD